MNEKGILKQMEQKKILERKNLEEETHVWKHVIEIFPHHL